MTAGIAALHEQVTRAFVAWRDDVYRYTLTLGLTPQEAQEVTQEVFLRLYIALRKTEEPIRDQRAWAFRVAHNVGLSIRSHEAAMKPFDPLFESTLTDGKQGAESGLIERERLARIHEAVKKLSPQQRHCLHLRAEGLRYQEIADAIGVSVSTVSEFLRRALVRLRKAAHE